MSIISLENLKKNCFNLLPYWFKAKRVQKGSTTASFLNPFIEEFHSLFLTIDKEYKKTNLDEYECNDYVCNKIVLDTFINIKINNRVPMIVMTEKEIVKAIEEKRTTAFYDIAHKILYITEVSISDVVVINDVNMTDELIEHRVWNVELLDEYGIEYDMPRLKSENNEAYKGRLKSYKRKLGNSSMYGISSYIGHYLGIYKEIEWIDGSTNIIIKSNKIICSKVYVDDEAYGHIKKDTKNSITLMGNSSYRGKTRKVTYFEGFDFTDIDDIRDEEKDALMDTISLLCPIMWGYARWSNISFLDEEEDCSYHYICPRFDDISFLKE